jgi:cellulose synthase operon protein C
MRRLKLINKGLLLKCLALGIAIPSMNTFAQGRRAAPRAVETSPSPKAQEETTATRRQDDSISEYQRFMSNVKVEGLDKELANADSIRRQSIRTTYSLLNDKTVTKDEKFELYLRLGQIHLERHDYLKHMELKSYYDKFDKYDKQVTLLKSKGYVQQAKKLKEPVYLQAGSKSELKKSVKALTYAVSNYPKERRIDIALYTLGQTKLLLGQDEGHKYHQRLMRDFPRSYLYPDAALALGEYYFDRNKHYEARQYYQILLDFKTHKGYLYAMYKLGWTNYNLSFDNEEREILLDKALAGFKIVIAQSERQQWSSSFNLREEALNDIILIFAEIGDVELARDYFFPKKEIERFYKTVMRIGSKLTDRGKNFEAIDTYNIVINERPFSKLTPEAFRKILENYEAMGKLSEVSKSIKSMIRFFGKKGLWAKHTKVPKEKSDNKKNQKPKVSIEQYAEARLTLEETTRYYSTKYHKIGQKSGNTKFLLAAAKIYKQYLQEFDGTKRSIELRHYLADILLGFKQYRQSGVHFMIVVNSVHGKKYRREALDNALFTFEKAIELEKYKKVGKLGKVPSPLEIPPTIRMYLNAMEKLTKLYPKDKRIPKAKFKIASTLYEYGHYDNSIKKFKEVTTLYPKNKLANKSTKIVLNHFYNKKKWQQTISVSTFFLKNKKLMGQKGLKTYILNLNKNAYFNYAIELENKNKFTEAADLFIVFQKTFPKDNNADKALYNASINYHKGGNTNKSIKTGQKMIREYPKSGLAKDMIAWVADTLESVARFDEAIVYYHSFHKKYPNDRRSRPFLFNASTLAMGLGMKKESIKLSDTYARFYPKDDSTEILKFNSAEMKLKSGKATEARKMYEELSFKASTAEKRLEAKAMGTVILLKQDRKSGANRLASFAKQLQASRVPAYHARQIVSEELLNLLEGQLLAYNNMKVNDGNRLMQDITAKNRKLQYLNSRLEQIANIGVSEYSVAALYILGDLHDDLANSINNAPYPRNITSSEKEDIRKQLTDVSTPLFKDSKAYFRRAYDLSQKTNTFSEWSIKTTRKMKDLFPKEIPISEYETLRPGYLSHKVIYNNTTKTLVD